MGVLNEYIHPACYCYEQRTKMEEGEGGRMKGELIFSTVFDTEVELESVERKTFQDFM